MERSLKECNRHEKRPLEDDILRVCQTCNRSYYACELCRNSKGIDAPLSICINPCAPAMKTLRTYIDKKDQEITDLKAKLKRSEAEIRMNEDIKKQLQQHKKTNDENIQTSSAMKQEIAELKFKNERTNNEYQQLCDEIQPRKELSNNLRSLLRTNEHADCTLVCGPNRYQVHKCVLASRSDEFRRLINESNEAKKANPNRAPTQTTIEIKDVEPEMMPLFLNYIYTAECKDDDINEQNVDKWVKISDKYKVNSLKKSCLLYREKHMNKETVVPILIEAHETDNDRLQQKCMRYMRHENIDLQQSPEWIEYKKKKPKEALELYESYVREQSMMLDENKFRRHNCLSPITLSRSVNYLDGNNMNKNNKRMNQQSPVRKPKELTRSSSQDSILNNLNSNASANTPKVFHITPKRVQIEEPLPTKVDHHHLAHQHLDLNEPRPRPIINYNRPPQDEHVSKVYQITPLQKSNTGGYLSRYNNIRYYR